MLYVETDGTIRLTRGDTARLTVNVEDDITGEEYVIQPADVMILTVKRTVRDASACFQKTITGSNMFHILPTDTHELAFGKYVYDVQLTTASGDVFTVIAPSVFEIMKEVTD